MKPQWNIKELLDRPEASVLIGAHNALGAKIAEEAGADGIWVSSFEVHTAARLPDADILGTEDYVQVIDQMVDRVQIPVLVDGNAGGGNAINTIRLVREYERASALYQLADIAQLDPEGLEIDKAYAVGSLHYLDDYATVRALLRRLLAAGIRVVAVLDVPDLRKKDRIERPYDMELHPHVYFDEDRVREDFDSVSVYRGRLPSYGNDAVRFSFRLTGPS